METVIKRHNRGDDKSNLKAPSHNDIPNYDNDDKTPTSGSQRHTPSGSAALPLSARRFVSVVGFVAGGAGLRREAAHLFIIQHPP